MLKKEIKKERIFLEDAVQQIFRTCSDYQDKPKKYPFFFIIGAGASSPSIKLAYEIIEDCKNECKRFGEEIEDSGKNDVDDYSYWLERAYHTPNRRREYFENLTKGRPLTAAHLRLAHLLSKNQVANIVVTPNFDDQLSRALWLFDKDHIRYDHPSTIERLDLSRDEIQVIHVHGNYLFYDIKNLRGEVEGNVTDSLMIDKLTAVMSAYSPIVIGYSGWEHDIIMTALRRSIHSAVQNNIYWFCYRENEPDKLPDFLTESPHVKFVIPNNPEMRGEVLPDSTRAKPIERMQVGGNLSGDLTKPPALPAIDIFDAINRKFKFGNPELTDDPIGFFIAKLQQVDPTFNPATVGDSPSQPDYYSIGMIIRQLSQAREYLEGKKKESGVCLMEIADAVRQSDYEKALSLCETADISAFNLQDQMPDFIHAIKNALSHLNFPLDKKITLLSNVIRTLDKDPLKDIPGIDTLLCFAMREKGLALIDSRQFNEGLKICKEVISRYGNSESHELQVQVAKAFVHSNYAFSELKQEDEAIKYADEAIKRFGSSDAPELKVQVAKIFRNKGVILGNLNRNDEAIAACDEVVKRFGSSDDLELKVQIAWVLVNKGAALGNLDRNDEAIAIYDEVIKRFESSDDPELKVQIAWALVNKGVALGNLNRHDKAIAACDDVVKRFGSSDAPELKEAVAMALVNKGYSLGQLNRNDEVIATCDEVIKRFGPSDTPDLKKSIAVALVNKGVALGNLNRHDEAIAIYDEVIKRFGSSDDPELKESVAKAKNFKLRIPRKKR